MVTSGYYAQAVAGLAKTTPVRFSSTIGEGAGSRCAPIRFSYGSFTEGGAEATRRIADVVAETVGVAPRRFYGGYAPNSFNIDGGDAVPPDTPAIRDIRTAGPMTGAGPEVAPIQDAITTVRPATRIVEWDSAGSVVRDEGGIVAPRYDGSRYFSPRTRPPGNLFGVSPFGWLILFGVGVLWLYRRATRIPAPVEENAPTDPRWRVPPEALSMPPPIAHPVPPPRDPKPAFPEPQVRELADLSALTDSEALVVALHRHGRELRALSRLSFDADLAEEINAIVERHFPHAIARYRQARPTLGGGEADQVDDMLRRALDRLSGRLHELRDEQHHRDMDGVDEATRFINARHPQA